MHPGRAGPHFAQAIEIIPDTGIFDPEDVEPGTPVDVEPPNRLARRPCLVGIDHHGSKAADRFAQQAKAVQVPFYVWVADLDLEAAIAERSSFTEKLDVFAVGEMEIEAAGVGADPSLRAAKEAEQGQAGLLGREIPAGLIDGFLERKAHAPRVAAPGPRDAMNEP